MHDASEDCLAAGSTLKTRNISMSLDEEDMLLCNAVQSNDTKS